MFCKGFEELFKAKLELCVNVGPWSQTRMCESARGRHYNPIFETNQLLFLFLPLLKVHVDQSLQLQQIFLHPLPVDILASQHTRTHAIRMCNAFFFLSFFLGVVITLVLQSWHLCGDIHQSQLSLPQGFSGQRAVWPATCKKKKKKKDITASNFLNLQCCIVWHCSRPLQW